MNRKARIDWLKNDDDDVCRILSNARCLSEGIDVPALDAVIFMTPRKSHVDIVQAVGRVMRKAEGKQYGYVVLPVAIPDGVDPADALNDNERFSTVWSVLRALRSHDDRLNAKINRIDLNKALPDQIIFGGSGGGDGSNGRFYCPRHGRTTVVYTDGYSARSDTPQDCGEVWGQGILGSLGKGCRRYFRSARWTR